jgi:hypothetical protein
VSCVHCEDGVGDGLCQPMVDPTFSFKFIVLYKRCGREAIVDFPDPAEQTIATLHFKTGASARSGYVKSTLAKLMGPVAIKRSTTPRGSLVQVLSAAAATCRNGWPPI